MESQFHGAMRYIRRDSRPHRAEWATQFRNRRTGVLDTRRKLPGCSFHSRYAAVLFIVRF